MNGTHRRSIAIYGGAFDPPHVGHAMVVQLLLNSTLVDEVWITPSGARSDKGIRTPAPVRAELAAEFVSSLGGAPRVRLEPLQLNEELPGSYTVDLMRALRARHPACTFAMTIGSELVSEIPTWSRASELLKEVPFLVVMRPGADTPRFPDAGMFSVVPNPHQLSCAVSSTVVRALCREQKVVAGVVSHAVEKIIRTHSLYGLSK